MQHGAQNQAQPPVQRETALSNITERLERTAARLRGCVDALVERTADIAHSEPPKSDRAATAVRPSMQAAFERIQHSSDSFEASCDAIESLLGRLEI